ncbi:low temperature requirement protein A [Streptomyces ipomoeae]|uniref:low temperature requirement protein A n=1 Tax=Streptomyces ipomoeae TaxID=103232 RepID=UPI001146DD0E|nr:low temperature requirement protein A [Streptomyces ipomoeae]MDX2931825.1 low temperature requirement protein A [Streptomyces ipomoeae]TQE29654.1 low temperature requirement protein A [Streptomyces ipomoeae]
MTTHGERTRLTPTADGHKVTPAELFFDLVFVYAITQVTALMAADATALRLLGGMVVLALLWWCWCCFAWLGNVVRADSGGMFAVLVSVMTVVLIVSLTVPEVYDDAPGGLPAPLLFVLCYGAVRALHLITYWLSAPDDKPLRATLRRTALLSVLPPFALLLVGAAFEGVTQILIWLAAVTIDYLGIFITGKSGWRVASPAHFSERHGLIVIIALGESIVAIGVGVTGYPVTIPVVAAAALGLLISAALWRLYFHGVSEPPEHRLAQLTGDARTTLARDVYTFLHLPLVAGVVITALGMKKTLQQVADTEHYGLAEPLHGMPAWALAGGVGLFLLASAAILLRTAGHRSPALITGGVLCLAAGPVVALVPALAALTALVAAVTALLILHGRTTHTAAGASRGLAAG